MTGSKGQQYIVEGFSALQEYLRLKPGAVKSIKCSLKHKAKMEELLKSLRIPVEYVEEQKRNKDNLVSVEACVEIHYQSLHNLISKFEKTNFPELLLALDHITDPRNLGAIARSAAFFGVRYILLAKNRQVLLTPASVSSSKGAFAYSELVLVPNLSQAIIKLKELGYWVLSADADGEPYENLLGVYERCVLVLGSEGKGVSSLLRKRSDRMLSIGSASKNLDSLNVSVAAGILLNAFSQSKVSHPSS